jgi:hypothetical protein
MTEKNSTTGIEEEEGVSRFDFLKTVGIGLGAAGLGAVMGGQALAEGDKKGKYVAVTNGGNDPNRAILALLLVAVQTPETRSPVGREPGFHESESYCTLETGYSASIHPLMPPGWR